MWEKCLSLFVTNVARCETACDAISRSMFHRIYRMNRITEIGLPPVADIFFIRPSC